MEYLFLCKAQRSYENRRLKLARDWVSCVSFVLSTRFTCLMLGPGVESPSIGDMNTIGARSRVHHTIRLRNHCVIGAGCMVVPSEDEVLEDFTVIYGPTAERRTWSGRGKIQEADLRQKHVEYLREMLPKFNRLRRTDNA